MAVTDLTPPVDSGRFWRVVFIAGVAGLTLAVAVLVTIGTVAFAAGAY